MNVSSKTHEGGFAKVLTPEQILRRSVLSTFLWEDNFYEDGKSVAERIAGTVKLVDPKAVQALAIEARGPMNLRHVPLWLVKAMVESPAHKPLVAETLEAVIQRPDELAEFLALYWKDGKRPLAAQVKKGLARAFQKFSAYSLAKYNQDAPVKLRDVMFLAHPKPAHQNITDLAGQTLGSVARKGYQRGPVLRTSPTWAKLAANELEAPDTWEVALSAGADKKATFTRLIEEKKLGAMALLRNLRNMEQAGVDRKLVREALRSADYTRVLPFRVFTAARVVPTYLDVLDEIIQTCAEAYPKLPGTTILLVDVSGSMYGANLSRKSDVNRAEAACTLAAIARLQCEDPRVYATGGDDYRRKHATQFVPAHRGLALGKAIYDLQAPLGGGGIFLKQALDYVWQEEQQTLADRVIVLTDEQDCDTDAQKSPDKARQVARNEYLINVAGERPGIGYGRWTHIDGFSDRVLDYVREVER
jgi:60 kDa SS-A/Ro ribonucleoprotein